MSRRGGAASRPPACADGFTLVEVLVALVVLMVGALGAAGTAFLAARRLDSVHTEERAAHAAALTLDSLLHTPAPISGERELEGFRLRWVIPGDATDPIVVVVEYDDGRTRGRLVFGALGPAPAPLPNGATQP